VSATGKIGRDNREHDTLLTLECFVSSLTLTLFILTESSVIVLKDKYSSLKQVDRTRPSLI
jgi:hypothetical protein